MLIQGEIFAYHLVNQLFYLAQLFVAHLLEMREVKTQRCGVNIGAFLLHVVAQHLFQSIVK